MSKLNALKIKSLSAVGMHSDGNGLHLKIQLSKRTNALNKSWIFRWGAQGKNTMGLGSITDLSLADARAKTLKCKKLVASGLNPRDERDKVKAEIKAAQAHSITFEKASKEYIKTQSEAWTNDKHTQQWTNTLSTYAFPKIGKVPCADITKDQILSILTPIWSDKHETATRIRGRIESVLDWAIAKGYRTAPNSAVLKGNLQPLLPAINKRKRVQHHNAMPYDDVPQFFATIKDDPSSSARALIFCILTATRTSETTDSKWTEINLDKSIWIVPKERMKRGIEHRVPLASQLTEILLSMSKAESEYVFYGTNRTTKPISNMTMLKYLQRKEGCAEFTVHGFRSSFRDWAAEKGSFPREVCEQALAHSLADQTEAAYQRADYFEKRVVLMQAWANYCYGIKKSERIENDPLTLTTVIVLDE
jgi:integrase